MKNLDVSLTAPAGLLLAFCGALLLFGTDPWLVPRMLAQCVPIVAYVVVADGAIRWAMHGGAAGRRYRWLGVPVVLYILLVAAGSVVMWLAEHVPRWLGGAA